DDSPDLDRQHHDQCQDNSDEQCHGVVELHVPDDRHHGDEHHDLEQPATQDDRTGGRGIGIRGDEHAQRGQEHEPATESRADEYTPDTGEITQASPHRQGDEGDHDQCDGAEFDRPQQWPAVVIELGQPGLVRWGLWCCWVLGLLVGHVGESYRVGRGTGKTADTPAGVGKNQVLILDCDSFPARLSRMSGTTVNEVASTRPTTVNPSANAGGTTEKLTAPKATTVTHMYSTSTTRRWECPSSSR